MILCKKCPHIDVDLVPMCTSNCARAMHVLSKKNIDNKYISYSISFSRLRVQIHYLFIKGGYKVNKTYKCESSCEFKIEARLQRGIQHLLRIQN